MKFQKILLTGLLTLSSVGLSAQYNTLSEWYIGPSVGTTMSTITLVPKLVDKLYFTGKSEGVSVRYISENHFGFQIDLNYFEAGWKEDLYGTKKASDYSYARNLNFVEMPFLMHAYTGSKAFRIFLNAGPKFSYLLSENEEIIDQTPENEMIQHGKLVENPFQYGLLGGAGFEIHLKRSVLGLEGRYCYNLSNIFNDAVGKDFNSSSLQTISLNVYYYFQLGGYNKK
ncbi:MAG: porin family protein [Bacteroidales bacterium]|nr:porin family protein [Bacteroidales bacterium]